MDQFSYDYNDEEQPRKSGAGKVVLGVVIGLVLGIAIGNGDGLGIEMVSGPVSVPLIIVGANLLLFLAFGTKKWRASALSEDMDRSPASALALGIGMLLALLLGVLLFFLR